MSAPLLQEVAPEIDTNLRSFYREEGYWGSVQLAPPPDPSYRLTLAMSVHLTYFDLATPLHVVMTHVLAAVS